MDGEELKVGFILQDQNKAHWHILAKTKETVHLYNPFSLKNKSLNMRELQLYKIWYPPTGKTSD